MKRYDVYDNYNEKYSTWYVGESVDIKALVKSLKRHERKCDKHNLMCNINSYFCGTPIIKPYRAYGLSIDEDGYWIIHNADTFLKDILLNENVEIYGRIYF